MKKFLVILVTAAGGGIGDLFRGAGIILFLARGVKAGELNYVVKKGFIFKTYEGKLIQNGLRSQSPSTVQSYEFVFSVSNPVVAEKLMLSSGKVVQLHYKEYMGSVPWRGYSEFVVDSIISVDAGK